jgi:hypothetical protein
MFENFCAANEFGAKHGQHCLAQGRCNASSQLSSLSFTSPVDHGPESFLHGHAGVTFVGRPFHLDEAHEHLARLRRWGLTFSKLLQLQHLTN